MMATTAISLGVALLAWKAPETLERTLKALSVLPLDAFSDRVIFFQEISEQDRAIAAKYGFRAEGNHANKGIREGIKAAVDACRANVVLFLECDCLLVGEPGLILLQLSAAAKSISEGECHTVRFRHLSAPGKDFLGIKKFERYWPHPGSEDSLIKKLRRISRPLKARRLIGHALYALSNPQVEFPEYIRKVSETLYTFDSSVSPWTNQSIMVNKDWFLHTLIPFAEANPTSRTVNGFPDLEKEVNCKWWRDQRFKLGQSAPGVFTHDRCDRPDGDEKTLLHSHVSVG